MRASDLVYPLAVFYDLDIAFLRRFPCPCKTGFWALQMLLMSTSTTADKGSQIKASAYVILALATIAVALRFGGRCIAQKAGLWWDDWLLLAALVRVFRQMRLDFL